MKRIALFLVTNLAIVLVLSITMSILGVEPYLNEQGLNLESLLIFAAVMGFGGSFISLALSKWMAKKSVGAQVITQPSNEMESWLLHTVAKYARQSGIQTPEVAIWHSQDVNAFATGMNKNKALVAVSTGLLNYMTREEAEAVIGHEIAHVANGDMVTLSLIQGVVNTFVIFFSRVLGYLIDKVVFKTENGNGPAFWVSVIVFDIILGILASIVVMWFSRRREFYADAGGAQLTSKQHMISALQKLQRLNAGPLPDKMAAFGISGNKGQGIKRLFMTHPPLEERIEALKNS
ncbi:MAG: protease HtpX [Limnobacter sp.]|nr:protease HtpX [Limnobacter sp.]